MKGRIQDIVVNTKRILNSCFGVGSNNERMVTKNFIHRQKMDLNGTNINKRSDEKERRSYPPQTLGAPLRFIPEDATKSLRLWAWGGRGIEGLEKGLRGGREWEARRDGGGEASPGCSYKFQSKNFAIAVTNILYINGEIPAQKLRFPYWERPVNL